MHGAFGRFANDFLDLIELHFLAEAAGAVDVRVRHGAAGVELEGDAGGEPALAETVDELRPIALGGIGEAVIKAVRALEYGTRADESSARKVGGADSRLRRPARMQAFGPRPSARYSMIPEAIDPAIPKAFTVCVFEEKELWKRLQPLPSRRAPRSDESPPCG